MFLRLLWESFARQRRRKLLAGTAILLGTTAVTAMLALALSIGDRIHNELAVYGANIVVFPKAEQLEVKVGGVAIKPSTGGAYLKESDLEKLHTIFWANNITGVSPELTFDLLSPGKSGVVKSELVGLWFKHPFSATVVTGAPELHPSWKITGRWPDDDASTVFDQGNPEAFHSQVVLGKLLADQIGAHLNQDIHLEQAYPHQNRSFISAMTFRVIGIVSTGDEWDRKIMVPLLVAQTILANSSFQPRSDWLNFNAISRVEVSARTKPEDAFARRDPDTLSPTQHEIWYCRPYANSIAYQIQEVMTGSKAEQVRRVEQTEGTVLSRISGLMWLVSAAALLAAGFAVSAAMATAVLERRREIGLMRSLGASKASIAMLFYAESGLLAILAGTVGYLAGSVLAFWLGARIFPGDGAPAILNAVLLPVILAMALIVAVAGSTPSIRRALNQDPSSVLRADA